MAAVDEKQLVGAVAACGGRTGDKAGERIFFPVAVDRKHILRKLLSQHGIDRTVELAVARGVQNLLPVLDDAQRDLRMREGKAFHGGNQRGGLHVVALHEFHARRRIIKQVADDDGCPVRTTGAFTLGDNARLQMKARSERAVCGFGQQINARDGGNRRQRLTAKAEGVNGLQIGSLAELTGGMAQESGLGIAWLHAAAVIGHAQKAHAAVLQFYGNIFRSGVHGVFYQLLGGAGRTLHDLTGGDQVGNVGRKLLNFRHKITSNTCNRFSPMSF